MKYAEAIKFLYELRWFGAKLGLENTFKLAALAGNPQNQLRFIHVAGTNGKGSTCAMLESIYRVAGLRVGLFTSPHLVSFRERMQVNRQLISEADVVRFVKEIQPWLGTFPAEHHPTFFEVVTVMALRHFAEQKCDLVIWETGLGGRLDATNIVTPLASVITNIQYDHQRWLGETLERIAAEKAGIIKPGVPVLTAAKEPEALAVIEATAKRLKAPFHRVATVHTTRNPKYAALPLLGEHQQMNAALAVATVGVLQEKIPVSETVIGKGLSTVNWPGRLQLVTRSDGRKVLLDAAHNPAGVATLRAALKEHFSGERPVFILGVMQDKDWSSMCQLLAPMAARILCVPVNSERGTDPAQLREACSHANPAVQVLACSSLVQAFEQAATEPLVVVAGSIYLIGEAMELLKLTPLPLGDEKGLNEWLPRRDQVNSEKAPSAPKSL